MDNQLKLHRENLALFLEPTFKRQTIGHYSIDEEGQQQVNDSEKASLIALKEAEKTGQGIIEYDVPTHLGEKDLTEGYTVYDDGADGSNQSELIKWLENQEVDCSNVDIICSSQTIANIFKAPYVEPTSTPWEVKVFRADDGLCFIDQDESLRERYNELNMHAKQQYFRNRAFQKFMAIKKGGHSNSKPPRNHKRKFYKVNNVKLDSGTVVYQSEVHCFDKNYNAIDLRIQKEGQFELPTPMNRLSWWIDDYLAGTNTVLCGYYDDDDNVAKLTAFDLKHVKPRRVHDEPFEEELCTAALCTFVEYVKELTEDGTISSCTLRFEPGSKRVCVLDVVTTSSGTPRTPRFHTQISASDEVSSRETTPRIDAELNTSSTASGLRQRAKMNGSAVPTLRRNTIVAENGGQQLIEDHDDDKYGSKRRRRRVQDEEDDLNWGHVALILIFVAIGLIGIPWAIERGILGRR